MVGEEILKREKEMNHKIMFYGGSIIYIVSFYSLYASYFLGIIYFFASIIVFLLWLLTHLYFMYVFKDELFETNGWYDMSGDENVDEDD